MATALPATDVIRITLLGVTPAQQREIWAREDTYTEDYTDHLLSLMLEGFEESWDAPETDAA